MIYFSQIISIVDWRRRKWLILILGWSTVTSSVRLLVVKKKVFGFITATPRIKVLVLGEAMLSGTTARMRSFFGSLFAAVKVSAKRRS
jgi:hypothetical protein